MLGAEEFGFSTAPLIAIGCIMMRKCHLNTCPVGIATQDPELRKKFHGKPEHVVNYFFMLAEGVREHLAQLGLRSMDELVGRVDLLDFERAIDHWKAKGLNLAPILHKPRVPKHIQTRRMIDQDHGLKDAMDNELIRRCEPAIERGERVSFEMPIRNINRTVGTMLSSAIARKYGAALLPDDTIHIKFTGSAGNSFACFGAKGLTLELEGDANDYFGKGLSGGRLIAYPPREATFVPEENIIIGNVAFYGATSGEAYVRGLAGERFCVRNSGVRAVVEGVGDHGCEYMTGGRVVVLGATGRNFAAGMSGGVAYVLDEAARFHEMCNLEMVDLEKLENNDLFPDEVAEVRGMIARHKETTGSTVAVRVLDNWDALVPKFVKIMPRDYKRALRDLAAEEAAAKNGGNGQGDGHVAEAIQPAGHA
jgi:glutamate synthase (ferredoxin)